MARQQLATEPPHAAVAIVGDLVCAVWRPNQPRWRFESKGWKGAHERVLGIPSEFRRIIYEFIHTHYRPFSKINRLYRTEHRNYLSIRSETEESKLSYEHSIKKIKPELWTVFARRCSFRVPTAEEFTSSIHQISCWWIDLPSRHKHQSLLSSTTDGQVLSCASCYKTWTETGSAMIPDSSSKTPHNSLTQTCIAD